MKGIIKIIFIHCAFLFSLTLSAKSTFSVIGFFTGKEDPAHVSFVQEANRWFSEAATIHGFEYDSTNNWNNLNEEFLSSYQVVIFLDTRPEGKAQRTAFENYMQNGGGWFGFHFSAFALTPSAYNQDWPWYHETFLGSGEYAGNTWRPTAAVLRVEDSSTPLCRGLPVKFKSAPNEWYKWTNDLRTNNDIQILLSIDDTSFPLGTGPKRHEIWNAGYYPVAWRNKKYKMVYVNMGHNDMDYESGSNETLSSSFSSETQNAFIINCLLWLGHSEN